MLERALAEVDLPSQIELNPPVAAKPRPADILVEVDGRRVPVRIFDERRERAPDRPAPCRTQVEVTACFAPLLAWVVSWWQGDALPLAGMLEGMTLEEAARLTRAEIVEAAGGLPPRKQHAAALAFETLHEALKLLRA